MSPFATRAGKVSPALLVLLLTALAPLSGCGKHDKTTVFVKPSGVPVGFSFSRKEKDVWAVSAGVMTQHVTVGIEQEFDRREQFTYIVFRDRARGTDQVFQVGARGYVELHTTGEHKLRLQREENKVVIDDEALSGTVNVNIYPDSQATARVEFPGTADVVLYSDKRMGVEYNSYIWSDDSLLLDTVQSVTYQEGLGYRSLVFDWKPAAAAAGKSAPFVVNLPHRTPNLERDVLALQSALGQTAPHLRFERTRHEAMAVTSFAAVAACFLGMFYAAPLWRVNRRVVKQARGKAGFWDSLTGKWAKGIERERRRARIGAFLTFLFVYLLITFGLVLVWDLEFVAGLFG